MRAEIRITIDNITDEEALKIKRAIEQILKDHRDAAIYLNTGPSYGIPPVPPPPTGRRTP